MHNKATGLINMENTMLYPHIFKLKFYSWAIGNAGVEEEQ